jgi:hypothetical protein
MLIAPPLDMELRATGQFHGAARGFPMSSHWPLVPGSNEAVQVCNSVKFGCTNEAVQVCNSVKFGCTKCNNSP